MRKCDHVVLSEVEVIYLTKGLRKKKKEKYTKWKKEEANENILMEQKPHGMRKVREHMSKNPKEQA